MRWVTHGLHQTARLFRRVDHRDQQVLYANIEQLLEDMRIADSRTRHRLRVVGRQRLQL